jgi:hypothetical protein
MKCVAVAVFLIAEATLAAAGSARTWAQDVAGDPDHLYAERARLDRAREAAAIWECA